jgi:hypothetical protein
VTGIREIPAKYNAIAMLSAAIVHAISGPSSCRRPATVAKLIEPPM